MERTRSPRRAFARGAARLLAAFLEGGSETSGIGRRRLASLVEHLQAPAARSRAGAPDRELARRLVAWAGHDRRRRDWLTDRLRDASRRLAIAGHPPRSGGGLIAWRALILTASRLHSSRVRRLPSRTFVSPELLDALTREGRARRPRSRVRRTQYAPPGPVLRRLAVDPALQRAASRSLGLPVEPAFTAVYMYDPPRSHMPPHLDSEAFEIIMHLVLEHVSQEGARRSALLVHRPRGDLRLSVTPGQAVVLAGRGAVHQWEPLGERERRMLIGIGFRPVRSPGSAA